MNVDDTKTRLLEAAGEEFAEKGFEGATVRSICQRAGANLAAVNYHFGDKAQLYVQAVVEAHRCGAGWIPDEQFYRGSLSDQLRRYIGHFLANVLAVNRLNSWHNTLMLREMLRPSEAADIVVEEAIRPRFNRLKRVIGQICPEAEDRKLHAICLSVVGQCLHYRMARAMSEKILGPSAFAELNDVDYLAQHIGDFTLAALGLAPTLDESGVPSSSDAGVAIHGDVT